MHREYGRVEDRRIGERWADRAVWTTVGLDVVGQGLRARASSCLPAV